MGVVGTNKVDLLPFLVMVVVQILFAGMNITSKLAMDSGLNPLVLVAYRQIFATVAMVPLAYFTEWKTLPKISKPTMLLVFVCSLTGTVGNQVFYFIGLQITSATTGCALSNTLPAITFVLAVALRQEHVRIRNLSGQAKVVGTLLCVAGAMVLSFYHGGIINIGQSILRWKFADQIMKDHQVAAHRSNYILGTMLIIASSFSWAGWFTLQAKLSKNFPAPYTTTLMLCSLGSIECTAIGLSVNHRLSDWSLASTSRLVIILYAGVVSTAITYSLTCWTIQRKGALYVSVFNPLLLVIVAAGSWLLLHEKLYVGTVVGSLLIVVGLYAVLWGKDRETKLKTPSEEIRDATKLVETDLELQSPADLKGNASG